MDEILGFLLVLICLPIIFGVLVSIAFVMAASWLLYWLVIGLGAVVAAARERH